MLGSILTWEVDGEMRAMSAVRGVFRDYDLPFKTTARSVSQLLRDAVDRTCSRNEFVIMLGEDRDKALVAVKSTVNDKATASSDVLDVDTVTWLKHSQVALSKANDKKREAEVWAQMRSRVTAYNARELGYAIAHAIRTRNHGILLKRKGGVYFIPYASESTMINLMVNIKLLADRSSLVSFSYSCLALSDDEDNKFALRETIDVAYVDKIRTATLALHNTKDAHLNRMIIGKKKKEYGRLARQVTGYEHQLQGTLLRCRQALATYFNVLASATKKVYTEI